jgi:hypothetical protein
LKFANLTSTVSADASPSAQQFDAELEPFAWPIITPLNAHVRQLAFTLAILPDRKVVAKLNVWPIPIAMEQSLVTAPPTLANLFAFKIAAAKMLFVWPKTIWLCALALLD